MTFLVCDVDPETLDSQLVKLIVIVIINIDVMKYIDKDSSTEKLFHLFIYAFISV